MQRALLLATSIGLAGFTPGCSRQAPPAESGPRLIELEPVALGPDSYEYVYAEEAAADVVFIVDLSAPHWGAPDTQRFPRKHNPGAPGQGLAPINLSWCAAGGKGGSSGSIGLSGPEVPQGAVTVRVSLCWTTRDNVQGQAEGKVVVPWLGEARKDLGGGASVHVRFSPPER
jgi:hypothetical protein